MEQRSPEWFAVRLGKLTASRMSDAMSFKKDKTESAERAKYRMQLICERLTGNPSPVFVNRAMQWGVEQENDARIAYELAAQEMVDQAGFVDHPSITGFGASPDGLIGSEGLVEIKCPESLNHLTWLTSKVVPAEHKPQMLAQLACTRRKWCDFVSYDPRFPKGLDLFVVRFQPTDEEIANVEELAVQFLIECDAVIEDLLALKEGKKS
jgi:putative phage-type endonuclease